MKTIDVYGLGNGIVDVLVEISEEEFSSLDVERGTMGLLEPAEQSVLLAQFSERGPKMVSGGSVANSTVLLSQLGATTAFSCRLAEDSYGQHYSNEFQNLNVQLPNSLNAKESTDSAGTGTCVVLVTPDAERTMRTALGISGTFGPDDIDEEVMKASKWVFIEGYLFCNPNEGQAAVKRAIALAKKHDTKIAITLSDAWIMNEFRDAVEDAATDADLIFANAGEAQALAQVDTEAKALEVLSEKYKGIAITSGENGSTIAMNGKIFSADAFPVSPADLTGAGDAFAGTLLYGLIAEQDLQLAARRANFMAGEVIQKVGARIQGNAKALWSSIES